MDEGYGLSQDGVENCLKKFPITLLLAVDCGSTAVESIAWLRERGVDVIVLDHHQVSSPAPAASRWSIRNSQSPTQSPIANRQSPISRSFAPPASPSNSRTRW